MNDKNNNYDSKNEDTESIIASMLNDMVNQVLILRKQHLRKLNKERVRRCRQRKRAANETQYTIQIREQKRRYRQLHRLKNSRNV